MKKINTNYLLIVLVFVGLSGIYITVNFIVPKTIVSFVKADPKKIVSVKNSYVLGGKILAKADGKDKCMVNVFLINEEGKGVSGKRVMLTGADDISAINNMTDNFGKASFEIKSDKEGQFNLLASVDGMILTNKVMVTFRN